jgi:hypothetical protein
MQHRNIKGQYQNKGLKWVWLVIAIALISVPVGTILMDTYGVPKAEAQTVPVESLPNLVLGNPIADKITELQKKVVSDVTDCESKGTDEPDGTIILDTNHEMSIGRAQWQIKSVQHYVKQFEGRDISKVEAIKIAIDGNAATELARKVMFSEKDGIHNWSICGKKVNAGARIDAINSLNN